ncbi:hypothetical protein [Flavihumibacter cheonanensis]|uniref:hypothetical protein n=1 Tax=Flavihumibacter cheonanensis TaxID=1442385 RepID=UPI001EF843F8|nr:hypothetical protein [Flavihumibacter cheonanensis]MCG7753543.1 hypothetical protein [Flavihumibacter cheonanensis]
MGRILRKHWILMGAGITLLVLGLVLGYLLRYRSVEAVEQLVNNLSGGQYKLSATSFRFNLFKFQINARNLHVAPTIDNDDNSLFEFKADSVSIQINNPIQLLLFKRLAVNKLILKSPYLELKRASKDSTRERPLRPLHIEIAAVQDVFFNVLSSLEVQQFRMSDGSVSIYPETSIHQRRFFLNHIYLALDDLHLLRKIKQWDNTNRVAVDFRLLKPTIEYPDSTLQVVLDKLVWQSKTRRFELSGLDFHKRVEDYKEKSGFRLENIELDSLNWNKLLTEGRIELGLLKAAKGYFTSNNIRFRRARNKDSVRIENSFLDVMGPIKIKTVQIDSIQFKGSTITRRGNESLEILGDNFYVSNLVVDNSLPNKIELDDLEFAVRGFLESDSNKTFQTGFDGMRIKKNQLTLQNYFLRASNRNKTANTSISTSQLILHNLSIPALLSGQLKADELDLISPNVRLQLAGKNTGKKLNPLREIQRTIRRKLQIETIRVFDADLQITASGAKKPLVSSTSFSAIISSNSVLRAGTLEELFDGKNRLEMPQLALRLKNFNVDLTNAVYEDNDLRASQAIGNTSENNIRFDLRNIHVQDINAAGIIEGKDTNWVRVIELGTGKVFIGHSTGKNKTSTKTRIPQEMIRNIRTGKLELVLDQPGLSVNTSIDSIAVDSLRYENQQWTWFHYYLAGQKLKLNQDKLALSIGPYLVSSEQSNLQEVQIQAKGNRFDLAGQMPGVQLSGSPASLKDPLASIKKAVLTSPDIKLVLKEVTEFEETAVTANRYTKLPALELIDPALNISRESEGRTIELFSNRGGNIQTDVININEGRVSTALVNLSLNKIIAMPEKTNLHIGNFQLRASNFHLDRNLETTIQKVSLGQGNIDHQTDNYHLRINDIAVLNKEPILFSSKKEELRKFLENLPNINLAADEVFYKKKDRKWELYKTLLDADKKIIGFDSIRFSSLISKDSFLARASYQTDFIEFHAGKGRILGLNREIKEKDTIWLANRIELDQFNMEVERDKRKPEDTVSYRNMLPGLIKKIPLNLEIGSALLTKSRIQYSETSGKTGKQGTVWFNDLNLVAGPIKNFELRPTDSLRITATTLFMDSGHLRFGFHQAYLDSLYGFYLLARMGKMELNALSPLLMPLFNLHIKQGRADSVWLRVKGNDYFAYGHMELDYRKLKFELYDENGRKKKFTSFLANLLIKNRNGKKGLVYQERVQNKSTFNYWGKIALSGLMTNLGVKSNRKYLRNYKKEAKRLEIPIELLD